jgi:hypothetical protein
MQCGRKVRDDSILRLTSSDHDKLLFLFSTAAGGLNEVLSCSLLGCATGSRIEEPSAEATLGLRRDDTGLDGVGDASTFLAACSFMKRSLSFAFCSYEIFTKSAMLTLIVRVILTPPFPELPVRIGTPPGTCANRQLGVSVNLRVGFKLGVSKTVSVSNVQKRF